MRRGHGYHSLYLRKEFQVGAPSLVESLKLRILYDDGFVAYVNGHEVARANVDGEPPTFRTMAKKPVEPTSAEIDLMRHSSKLVSTDNVLAVQGHNARLSLSDFILTPVLYGVIKRAPSEKKAEGKVASKAFRVSEGPVRALAFSPDARQIASGGDDKIIGLWSVADGKELGKLENDVVVTGLAFVDADTLLASGDDGVIKVWGLKDAKVVRSLNGHEGAVNVLALRADGRQLASAGDDGTVRLWNPKDDKVVRKIVAHEGPVLSIAYTPDGKGLVSGGDDGELLVWDIEAGTRLASFSQGDKVRSVAGDGENRYLAVSSGGVSEWFRFSKPVRTFTGHRGLVHRAVFSPNGKTAASAGSDKTVRFWNLLRERPFRSVEAHDATVYSIEYNPDGSLLASGGYDTLVKLWDTRTGKEVRKLAGHDEVVVDFEFSNDGKSLFSCSFDMTVRKWSVEEGKEVAVYKGHPERLVGLALGPQGKEMISLDFAGHLISWNLHDGKILARRALSPVVYGIALSPDGNWLLTANGSSSAFLIKAR